MLRVWLLIFGSLALAAYLWMRIDDALKLERAARKSAASTSTALSEADQ